MAESEVRLELMNENSSVEGFRYMLPVENISHEITREAVVFPMPEVGRHATGDTFGFPNAGQPSSFALDFGMLDEHIILSGLSKDNEVQAQVVAIDGKTYRVNPSHQELSNFVRTHWRTLQTTTSSTTGAPSINGGVRVTIYEGNGQGRWAYRGIIKGFRAEREGGKTRWDWTLTIQVLVWPPEGL